MSPGPWRIRDAEVSLDVPVVMGILNVTPDSFSDGGNHLDPDEAIQAGLEMMDDGAAVVDVGGESTRPGAQPVAAAAEIARVLPVVRGLVAGGAVVSVDTSKASVARTCIEAGAHIVNDVTAMSDPEMMPTCAEAGVGVVLMHMLGTPATMQKDPTYGNVVREVAAYLGGRAESAIHAGISHDSITIDPGIGFGKAYEHNIDLMANLGILTRMGYPVLVGASRKGFLGSILESTRGDTTPVERDAATAAAIALAVAAGVSILRVHNVRLGVDVARAANAMVPVEGYEQETDRT